MENKRDVNSYSTEGRIFQLEYAMKASSLGTTALAFTTPTSTFLISEIKKINKLQKPSTKHFKISDNIVFSFSGIAGDAKNIVKRAREEALNHLKMFNEEIPVEGLLKYLSQLALQFGEEDAAKKIFGRPFGCSIIVAGFDQEPVAYMFDPSGSYRRFRVTSIGSGSESLEADLCDIDTVEKAVSVLARVMKDDMEKDNVEICEVSAQGIRFFNENEVSSIVSSVKGM